MGNKISSAHLVLFLGICLSIWMRPALANSMLGCPAGVVSLGDAAYELDRKCGAPVAVRRSLKLQEVWQRPRAALMPSSVEGAAPEASLLTGRRWMAIEVEIWTYNFGPNRFMREIHLHDGHVVRINSLGYGYR